MISRLVYFKHGEKRKCLSPNVSSERHNYTISGMNMRCQYPVSGLRNARSTLDMPAKRVTGKQATLTQFFCFVRAEWLRPDESSGTRTWHRYRIFRGEA